MKRRAQRGGLWVVALCLVGMVAPGCGGPKFGTIAGVVKFEGKTLGNGTVTALWDTGKVGKNGSKLMDSEGSPIGKDGSFKISKVPAGQNVRLVVRTYKIGVVKFGQGQNNLSEEEQKKIQEQGGYVEIPNKYSVPESSGLSLDVKEGSNSFDIDLKP